MSRNDRQVKTAKNAKTAEIHRQLVVIYGENVMIDELVKKWVR